MINLILRLYDCTQGEIRIDGVDIKQIDLHSLRSQVGVVLQETFLFDGNVLENIAYAKPNATFEEVIKAAKIANAHDFITKLPDGYNTRVGNKGYQLSGGERQKVMLARALAQEPTLLLLDEPTSNLDIRNQYQVLQITRDLCREQNLTAMIVIHDLNLALRFCDRFLLLREGAVYRYGGAEIFDADALRDVYGVTGSIVDVQGQKLVLIDDEEKETRS